MCSEYKIRQYQPHIHMYVSIVVITGNTKTFKMTLLKLYSDKIWPVLEYLSQKKTDGILLNLRRFIKS